MRRRSSAAPPPDAFLDLGEILKEGTLQKKSPSGLKTWQSRTFRLYASAILYSETGNWCPSEKQKIPLEQIAAVKYEKEREFQIMGGKVHVLKAKNEEDAKSWVMAIRDAMGMTHASVAARNPEAPKELGGTYGQARVLIDEDISSSGMILVGDALKPWQQKCRIVCAMSQKFHCTASAESDVDRMSQLIEAGMNMAFLDFSEDDHAAQEEILKRIREAASKQPDKHIGIVLSTKGPEVRTGCFRKDIGKEVELKEGQEMRLVVDFSVQGDSNCIAISYAKLCDTLKVGDIIQIADHALSLRVKNVGQALVITEVMNGGVLAEFQKCKFPGIELDISVLTEKDVKDVRNFGIPHRVDFIAVCIMHSANDIKSVRKVLSEVEGGSRIKILARIESLVAVKHFFEILDEADGIILMRAELSLEIPIESLFLAQKMIIGMCNLKGKPVMLAGQVLDHARNYAAQPARLDVSDVANSVLDGTDCIVVDGEKAVADVVRSVRKIYDMAERVIHYNSLYFNTQLGSQTRFGLVSNMDTMCCSMVKTAIDAEGQLLITLSDSGGSAILLAKYRPRAPILAVTTSDVAARQLQFVRGVVPLLVEDGKSKEAEEMIAEAVEYAKNSGMVQPGDRVIVFHGQALSNFSRAGRRTSILAEGTIEQWNNIKMLTIPNPIPQGQSERPSKSSSSKAPNRGISYSYNANNPHIDGVTYGQARVSVSDNPLDVMHLEDLPDSHHRKSKIICTIGPSSADIHTLLHLIDAGMNAALLDFSQGTQRAHIELLERIRSAVSKRPGKRIATMIDTKGPVIRTGFFHGDEQQITLKQGQELKLTTDYNFLGDSSCIAVSYDKLCETVNVGNLIVLADGGVSLKVKSVGGADVITEVLNDWRLSPNKSCRLIGVHVDIPVQQQDDVGDVINFAISQKVDFIAASMVQRGDDVKAIQEALAADKKHPNEIKVLAKIQSAAGCKNFEDILEEADGIIFMRNDVNLDMSSEDVFLAQKMIIGQCNMKGKMLIVATQMLDSMVKALRPAAAEASDLANAVLDGADCVMLGGPTADGDFPVEAVTTMRRIIQKTEKGIHYDSLYESTWLGVQAFSGTVPCLEQMCASGVKNAIEMDAQLLVAVTESGDTALLLAKYRPWSTILAVVPNETLNHQLQCVRGVVPLLQAKGESDVDKVIAWAVDFAKSVGMVSSQDVVIAIYTQAAPPKARKKSDSTYLGESHWMKTMSVPGMAEE